MPPLRRAFFSSVPPGLLLLALIAAGAFLLPQLFESPPEQVRVPDLIGIAQYGTVFTGGTSKIAEHGGDAPQDRNVPLVVSGAGVGHGK